MNQFLITLIPTYNRPQWTTYPTPNKINRLEDNFLTTWRPHFTTFHITSHLLHAAKCNPSGPQTTTAINRSSHSMPSLLRTQQLRRERKKITVCSFSKINQTRRSSLRKALPLKMANLKVLHTNRLMEEGISGYEYLIKARSLNSLYF